jgi:hypothetical protein
MIFCDKHSPEGQRDIISELEEQKAVLVEALQQILVELDGLTLKTNPRDLLLIHGVVRNHAKAALQGVWREYFDALAKVED